MAAPRSPAPGPVCPTDSAVLAPELLAGARRSGAGSSGLAVLAGLGVRRWAVALGTTPRGLLSGAALVAPVLAGLGWALAGRVPGRRDEVLALGLVVAVWALAAGYGILAAHATTVPPSLGFLRTMPVSRVAVETAAALPVAVLGAAGWLVLGPPAIVATAAAAGRGAGPTAVALAVTAVAGGAIGAILHGLAGRLTADTGAAPLRLTLAVLAWFGLVGLSLAAALPALGRLGDEAGAWALAPLGWSLPWWALVEPAVATGLGAIGVAVVVLAGALVARPAPSAPRVEPVVRRLRIEGPSPLVRVEARRLVRHPRTLEALVVAGATAVALVAGAAWASRRVPGAVDPAVIALLGAQVTSAPAALARGLSDRRRPAEATLGLAPRRHVAALWTGGLVVVVLVTALALVGAAVLLSPVVAGAWLAALVPFTAVAVLVSVALTPELGNGSAEAGAVLAAALATTVLVATTGERGVPMLVALGGATTLAALTAATALERAHRRPT